MSFMNNLQKQTKIMNNQTFTENGDLAVRSTLNANLDLFGLGSSARGVRKDKFQILLLEALNENKVLAIKNLFQIRDIRSGSGERKVFRDALEFLVKADKDIVVKILPFISEIGRWDDVVYLVQFEEVRTPVLEFLHQQFQKDIVAYKKNEPVSLLAKWLPSQNTSSAKTRELAKIVMDGFKLSPRSYRKHLSALRKYLAVLEVKLTKKQYDFDYGKIPSKAMMKYTKAFYRNDQERFEQFKDDLKSNKVNISKKVNTLFPYEIVRKVYNDKDFANLVWEQFTESNKDISDKKFLVVRDGSASMLISGYDSVKPLDVADSLAIYMSNRLTGDFKDKFVTFSTNPKFVDLSNVKTLSEKMRVLSKYTEVANTDIERVYDLIFKTSLTSNPEDLLDGVIIVSDMQFDMGSNTSISTYDAIKDKFEKNNIKFPKMIYWNVNARKFSFPTADTENAVFLSGFSKNIFEDIIKGDILNKSAITVMLDTLSKYDYLDEIFE